MSKGQIAILSVSILVVIALVVFFVAQRVAAGTHDLTRPANVTAALAQLEKRAGTDTVQFVSISRQQIDVSFVEGETATLYSWSAGSISERPGVRGTGTFTISDIQWQRVDAAFALASDPGSAQIKADARSAGRPEIYLLEAQSRTPLTETLDRQ